LFWLLLLSAQCSHFFLRGLCVSPPAHPRPPNVGCRGETCVGLCRACGARGVCRAPTTLTPEISLFSVWCRLSRRSCHLQQACAPRGPCCTPPSPCWCLPRFLLLRRRGTRSSLPQRRPLLQLRRCHRCPRCRSLPPPSRQQPSVLSRDHRRSQPPRPCHWTLHR
jgi:hypothetical protein